MNMLAERFFHYSKHAEEYIYIYIYIYTESNILLHKASNIITVIHMNVIHYVTKIASGLITLGRVGRVGRLPTEGRGGLRPAPKRGLRMFLLYAKIIC